MWYKVGQIWFGLPPSTVSARPRFTPGMTPRRLQQLCALIALAVALIAPSRAWAAFLPACENRELATVLPREQPEPIESDACSAVDAGDDVTDSKVAALCDPRGASVIAPLRIHAISDARIESSAHCGVTISTPMIGPAPDDGSSIGALVAMPSHALLPGAELVPAASYELAPDFPPLEGGARSGVERDVYHPPR